MIPSFARPTTRLRRRLAAALAVAVTGVLPLAAPAASRAQADDRFTAAAAPSGYWMVASDGGIFSFGDARFFGSTGDIKLNQPIAGIAATPSGKGYWMVATDGGIFSFGDAAFYGSTGAIKLNKPIVGMAATPSGRGYWLVASDGGIFAFGDAEFFGSTGNLKLNKPIVGMASSPTGKGYWFVASDGGIFAFGDAAFYGSTGSIKLAKPITAMAATASGKGYWFTASDGGVFAYGDAKFLGAKPSAARTVTAMVPSPDGNGYWMASSTGELLAFGSAGDRGGLTRAPNRPIVGMTVVPAGLPSGPHTFPTTGGPDPTTPATPTTLPPYTGPMRFSSTALHSWGTPPDTSKGRINKDGVTVYPYSQKVSAIVEIGGRVYIGGEFMDLHQNNHPKTPTLSGVPMDYLAELDTNGNPVPGSAFNATVTLDGPVRALYRSPDGRRLYVGGEFNRVNGENRPHLVALDPATGQIDRSFNPPAPDRYVNAITVHGSRLYIAGAFTMLGSTSRLQLAAFDVSTGNFDAGFNPPTRYSGKFVGHTGKRVEDPLASDPTTPDPSGSIEALMATPDGEHLMVGGSFLHFGFDHTADPGHKHSGLITIDPVSGGLCGQAGVRCTWQPEQSSNSSRPIFGMGAYTGDPKTIGIDAAQLVFTASGGAGGRVIAWTPGGRTTQLWRGNMDGDALSVVATHDRVYVVGHYDHTVPDPNDPCLGLRDQNPAEPGDQLGVSCPNGTPSRHLTAFHAAGEIVNGRNTGKSLIDTEFTAQADTSEGPYVVALGANRMYVGGNFTDVADKPVRDGLGQPVRQPGFAVYPRL